MPADRPRISPSVSSDVVVVGEVGGGDGVVGEVAVGGAVAGGVVSGEVVVVWPPQLAISNVVINRRAISPAII